MLELPFSTKVDWGSYITSIAKTAALKIGTLICFIKFPSPDVALLSLQIYHMALHRILSPCLGLFTLEMLLDKLQNWACRTVGPSLAAFLKPLAHP